MDVRIPGFPEKKWFGKLKSGVVERRRLMLQEWLRLFMKSKQTLPLLLRFLQAYLQSTTSLHVNSLAIQQNPETLPQTVTDLVKMASKSASASPALSSLRSLLTSDNFHIRKTAIREFLNQSVSSWQQMQLNLLLLDLPTRNDALAVFKVICDSGQFEDLQLLQIVRSRTVE